MILDKKKEKNKEEKRDVINWPDTVVADWAEEGGWIGNDRTGIAVDDE